MEGPVPERPYEAKFKNYCRVVHMLAWKGPPMVLTIRRNNIMFFRGNHSGKGMVTPSYIGASATSADVNWSYCQEKIRSVRQYFAKWVLLPDIDE